MGGLRKRIPWTFWTYMAGTLALAGIFPFAGFWSKDEILLDASHFEGTALVYMLLVIAARIFTAFYMGRQVWMVFFGEAPPSRCRGGQGKPLDDASCRWWSWRSWRLWAVS